MSETPKPIPKEIVSTSEGITRLCIETGTMNGGSPNLFLIEDQNEAMVFDTGWGKMEEMDLFERKWGQHGGPRVGTLVTSHSHPDHIGGVGAIRDITRPERIFDGNRFQGEHEIVVGNRRFITIPTPGHTDDSICLFEPSTGILLSGDTIVGAESVFITDVAKYMQSLQLLKNLDPKKIFPGHGDTILDVPGKIDSYIDRMEQREGLIINRIKRRKATIDEIIRHLYSEDLRGIGGVLVDAHIKKLTADGVVTISEDGILSLV